MCSGNICRSPLAHKYLEKLVKEENLSHKIEVDSCGIGAWHEGQNADSRMRAVAASRGLKFNKHARSFKSKDLEEFHYIIAMDWSHVNYLKSSMHFTLAHDKKISLLREYDSATQDGYDVPDPYYGGTAEFERVYNIIDRSCKQLLKDIKHKHQIS